MGEEALKIIAGEDLGKGMFAAGSALMDESVEPAEFVKEGAEDGDVHPGPVPGDRLTAEGAKVVLDVAGGDGDLAGLGGGGAGRTSEGAAIFNAEARRSAKNRKECRSGRGAMCTTITQNILTKIAPIGYGRYEMATTYSSAEICSAEIRKDAPTCSSKL